MRFAIARSASSPTSTGFPHEFPDLEAAHGVVRGMISDPGHLRNRRRAERTHRRQQLHGRAVADRGNRSDQRRSRRAEQRRRPRDDAAHARSRRRESTAGRPAGADRLSQSIAQPVREARLRNPRAAVGDDRIADQRVDPRLRCSRRHRRRPRRMQPAMHRRSMDTIAPANCAMRSRTGRRQSSSISAASPATRAQSDTAVTRSANRTRSSRR